jgi:hypothetical protein
MGGGVPEAVLPEQATMAAVGSMIGVIRVTGAVDGTVTVACTISMSSIGCGTISMT